jgi:hypothetical protein
MVTTTTTEQDMTQCKEGCKPIRTHPVQSTNIHPSRKFVQVDRVDLFPLQLRPLFAEVEVARLGVFILQQRQMIKLIRVPPSDACGSASSALWRLHPAVGKTIINLLKNQVIGKKEAVTAP